MNDAGHGQRHWAHRRAGRSVGHELGHQPHDDIARQQQSQPLSHSQWLGQTKHATGDPVGAAGLHQHAAEDDGPGVEPHHAPVHLGLVVAPVDDAARMQVMPPMTAGTPIPKRMPVHCRIRLLSVTQVKSITRKMTMETIWGRVHTRIMLTGSMCFTLACSRWVSCAIVGLPARLYR